MNKEFIKFHEGNDRQQWVFWRNMPKMKTIFLEDTKYSPHEVFEFSEWLDINFGIKILFDDKGNVLRDYVITDEKKYLFYKLKYE